jgi:hypothetical protein
MYALFIRTAGMRRQQQLRTQFHEGILATSTYTTTLPSRHTAATVVQLLQYYLTCNNADSNGDQLANSDALLCDDSDN